MSSGLFEYRLTLRRCILLLVTAVLVVGLTQPVAATTAPTDTTGSTHVSAPDQFQVFQQSANETDGTQSDGNGTAANESSDESSGGGIVGTILGVVGGLFGGIISFFADNVIGQAIIGLSLGIFIGLKGLAIYIERYE